MGVNGFLVSKKYDNPEEFCGKPVYKIEDLRNENLGTVIIAASWHFVKEIVKDLSEYKIKNLWVLSPLVYDLFPMDIINAGNCKISAEAAIAKDVQIFADEMSEIIVEFGTLIYPKAVILAAKGSKIVIKSNTIIGEKALISADNGKITIGESSSIGSFSALVAHNGGKAQLGRNVVIGSNLSSGVSSNGVLKISDFVSLGSNGMLYVSKGVTLIEEQTTVNNMFYISCHCSKIKIGKDNMFSHYVKMNAGSHEYKDKLTGKIIDNTMPIITGNHVWGGMGSTFLPNCNIGDGCIVGAASVVNKTIPANCICAGVPAKIIRRNIEWTREKSKQEK